MSLSSQIKHLARRYQLTKIRLVTLYRPEARREILISESGKINVAGRMASERMLERSIARSKIEGD
jgi:hypothetical protein